MELGVIEKMECSKLSNKRKQVKLLWLLNSNDQTAENCTNIRRDTCRNFRRKKKRNYMNAKVNKLEENSRNTIVGIYIGGLMNSNGI